MYTLYMSPFGGQECVYTVPDIVSEYIERRRLGSVTTQSSFNRVTLIIFFCFAWTFLVHGAGKNVFILLVF